MSRDTARQDFITSAGWGDARVTPLARDASFRQYYRLERQSESAILMDAPPDKEATTPFVRVADYLLALGFSAPRRLAYDAEAGFMLLEDFGNATFTRVLASQPEREGELYERAVDVLIALQATRPNPDIAPVYDEALLLREVMLLPQWLWHGQTDVPVADLCQRWQDAWQPLLPKCVPPPNAQVLVLRDYHVDNLMDIAGRPGHLACGLLDFQDAVWGHPAYDLVSLLQDARRDVPAALQNSLYQRFLKETGYEAATFHDVYTLLGLQRACKIIGIFNRLDYRDGKPHYRAHLPRVWRMVQANLALPLAKPVAMWFEHTEEFLQRCR